MRHLSYPRPTYAIHHLGEDAALLAASAISDHALADARVVDESHRGRLQVVGGEDGAKELAFRTVPGPCTVAVTTRRDGALRTWLSGSVHTPWCEQSMHCDAFTFVATLHFARV